MCETPKVQSTQREVIRQAFEALGYEAKPQAVASWIKENYDRDVKTQTISVEKNWMKKDYVAKTEKGRPATGITTNGAAHAQEDTGKTAAEALALLKRLKAFADEVGGVERLKELLDYLC